MLCHAIDAWIVDAWITDAWIPVRCCMDSMVPVMLFIQGSMGLFHNLPGIHRHLAVQDQFPVLSLRMVLKIKQIFDIALRPLDW